MTFATAKIRCPDVRSICITNTRHLSKISNELICDRFDRLCFVAHVHSNKRADNLNFCTASNELAQVQRSNVLVNLKI